MKNQRIIPVILSGGMGTRLWPLSRSNRPKQFLDLSGSGKTLIQDALARVSDRALFNAPILLCNEKHRFLVAEKTLENDIHDAKIILEPVARNTAPAIAAAALFALQTEENPLLLILPSDHIILNNAAFLNAVEKAVPLAATGRHVTFGITPDRAETGFGYIRKGAALDKEERCFAVESFVEKPDEATAQTYLDSGDYSWNSGMFLLSANVLLHELEKLEPAMLKHVQQAVEQSELDRDFTRLGHDAFAAAKDISIDYALMERTPNAAIIPVDCGWCDAGSWAALHQMAAKDANQNIVNGAAHLVDTEHCYITCDGGTQVTTLGVSNLAIISTKDCILVADLNRAQDVKGLVATLQKEQPKLVHEYRQEYRPWGHYDSIDKGSRHQVKRISVKPGQRLSLQMHYHRAEHWIVVRGTALVNRGEEQMMVTENQSIYIPCGTTHRIANPGKIPLDIIEVQSGSYLGEDDIVRFEDTYGRAANHQSQKEESTEESLDEITANSQKAA